MKCRAVDITIILYFQRTQIVFARSVHYYFFIEIEVQIYFVFEDFVLIFFYLKIYILATSVISSYSTFPIQSSFVKIGGFAYKRRRKHERAVK